MTSYSICEMSVHKIQTRAVHTPPPPSPAAKKASLINGIGTHLFTRHDTLLVVIIIN